MLSFEELVFFVKQHCNGEAIPDETSSPKGVKISADDLVNVCENLHRSEKTYFDMLSCVTALDNGPQVNTMEMIYNLYSIPYNHHLTLKVLLLRDKAEVPTLTTIWKTADWHEREAYDMFGISFTGHPDLR